MSTAKQSQIKHQVTGKLLTAVIDKKKYTVSLEDDKAKVSIKKMIADYNKKNSTTLLDSLKALLTPVATKKATDLMVQKKQVKNQKKTVGKAAGVAKKKDAKLNEALNQVSELTTIKTELENKNKSLEDRIAELEKNSKVVAEVPKEVAKQAPQRRNGEY